MHADRRGAAGLTFPAVRAIVQDKQSGRSQEIAVTYKGAGILSEEELRKRGFALGRPRRDEYVVQLLAHVRNRVFPFVKSFTSS